MSGYANAIQAFVAAGWTLVRHTNHAVLRCPCGKHTASIATTTGDHRTARNNQRLIRACVKGT